MNYELEFELKTEIITSAHRCKGAKDYWLVGIENKIYIFD